MNRAPVFILSDESGRVQLGKVEGSMEQAQQSAAAIARMTNQNVLIYAMVHIATYGPNCALPLTTGSTRTISG